MDTKKLRDKIAAQVKAAAGKGAEAAIRFLHERVREAISVKAPRVKGVVTPATVGKPIRMVSGRTYRELYVRKDQFGRWYLVSPTKSTGGFRYPMYHEVKRGGRSGEHPWVAPTAKKYRSQLRTIAKVKTLDAMKRK